MKKEALAMKKAGDKAGAMKLFKKAMDLQKQVEQTNDSTSASAAPQPSPPPQAADDKSTALAEARAQPAEAAKWSHLSKAEKGEKVYDLCNQSKEQVDEVRSLLAAGADPDEHKVSE